jgi:serralysin
VTKSSNNTPWTTLHRHQFDDSSGSMAPDWTADTGNSGDTLAGDAALFYSSPDGGGNAFAAPPSTSPSQAAASSNAQSPYSTISVTSGGMTINLEFVTADNPTASFEADVVTAATLLSAAIHNQITVNITVGYGEVNGQPLTNGSAAAGPDLNGGAIFDSYSTVRADLIANAAPGDTNFNSLPNGSSIGGQSNVRVYTSQQKLFGQLSATGTGIDGGAGFATDIQTFFPQDKLVGVALHELTHAMGRVPRGPEPNIVDFYRFTSPGTRLFSNNIPSAAAYFSVDGGTTKLADYGQKSDPSDFANSNFGTPII